MKTNNFDATLDIHGFTVEEALIELDYFLNQHLGEYLLIIHGRGSGKLRKAVRDYLEESPLVEQKNFGEDIFLPGSDGVTAVEVISTEK